MSLAFDRAFAVHAPFSGGNRKFAKNHSGFFADGFVMAECPFNPNRLRACRNSPVKRRLCFGDAYSGVIFSTALVPEGLREVSLSGWAV